MRIPRVYIAEAVLTEGAQYTLEAATSHYLSTVLRMEAGRPVVAFCGNGFEYEASLTTPHKKNAVITVHSGTEANRESPLHTHLAIGLSRGERFDFVLQKACELGVTEITPLMTERTEVKLKGERLDKKQAHWQQILISACEQCQRNRLPILNPLISLSELLTKPDPHLKLVLHHRSEKNLKDHATPSALTLLVGPEGGLSDSEIATAEACGYAPVTLGPRVLRTETAPITALSAVQLLWGDF